MIRASLCLSGGVLLIALCGFLTGLHLQDYLEVSFLLPLGGAGIALATAFSWREFAELGRQLRGGGSADPTALERSKVIVRSAWNHLWQMSGLFLLLQLMLSLHHNQDPYYMGHFLALLLESAIYLVLLRALVFLPAELGLARRGP